MELENATAIGLLEEIRDAARELNNFARGRFSSRGGIETFADADVRRVTLLDKNVYRHLAVIVNDSTAVMFLSLGAQASTDSYTVKLNSDDYYETPAGYTGPVTAVWAAANGRARVTELS